MDQKSLPLIIRDSREKPGHGWDWPACKFFRGTKTEKLSVGDYSIEGLSHLIFIDRKESVFEISGNLCEKRFHTLLKKASFYKYKYLLFQFSLEELLDFPMKTNKAFATDKAGIPLWKKIKIKGTTIHKSLMTIEKKYDIKMKFFSTRSMAEIFCHNLLKEIYTLECLNEKA